MDKLVIRPAGPDGTYRVGYLLKAAEEGQKELASPGYAYAVRMATRLRFWGVPEEMRRLRVEPVDTFYELKLKGNVLGRKNVRVFFGVFEDRRTVLVLGIYKKEEEDEIPPHIVIRMRNRQRVVARMLATTRTGG